MKQEVLTPNFAFKDLSGSGIKIDDVNDNRVESVNMLNTPQGTTFNATVSNKKALINFDIQVNVEDKPLNLLPKLQSINASIISENKTDCSS